MLQVKPTDGWTDRTEYNLSEFFVKKSVDITTFVLITGSSH